MAKNSGCFCEMPEEELTEALALNFSRPIHTRLYDIKLR